MIVKRWAWKQLSYNENVTVQWLIGILERQYTRLNFITEALEVSNLVAEMKFTYFL